MTASPEPWFSFVPQVTDGEPGDRLRLQLEFRAAELDAAGEVALLARAAGGAVPRAQDFGAWQRMADLLRLHLGLRLTQVHPSADAVALLDAQCREAAKRLQLGPTASRLFLHLHRHGGVCDDSYSTIAQDLAASRRGVIRAVQRLSDLGLIEQRGGQRAGVTGLLVLTGDTLPESSPERCHRSVPRESEYTDRAEDYTADQVRERAERYLRSSSPRMRAIGQRLIDQLEAA